MMYTCSEQCFKKLAVSYSLNLLTNKVRQSYPRIMAGDSPLSLQMGLMLSAEEQRTVRSMQISPHISDNICQDSGVNYRQQPYPHTILSYIEVLQNMARNQVSLCVCVVRGIFCHTPNCKIGKFILIPITSAVIFSPKKFVMFSQLLKVDQDLLCIASFM